MLNHAIVPLLCAALANCGANPSANRYEASSTEEIAAYKRVSPPFRPGTRFVVSQGAFGPDTHAETGNEYLWDLDVPYGTTVLAIESGVVLWATENGEVGGCDRRFNDLVPGGVLVQGRTYVVADADGPR
jgi:murein DD-endopeptidase MepM/ murein hydrolase activator NlpD